MGKGGQGLKIKKKKKKSAQKGLENSRQRSRIQMEKKQCLDYEGWGGRYCRGVGGRWAGGREVAEQTATGAQ